MTAIAELHRSQEQDAMPSPINFTDSAAQKVAQLIEEEGNPDLKLRVFVQGGGCSGFQYGFTFDEIMNDDDTRDGKERRHPADRFDELPVPARRRNRLQGRPRRRPVRHQEPERHLDLRLRFLVLGVIVPLQTLKKPPWHRRRLFLRLAKSSRGIQRAQHPQPRRPRHRRQIARLAPREAVAQPGKGQRLDPVRRDAQPRSTTGIAAAERCAMSRSSTPL
jgi:hypothetical protein